MELGPADTTSRGCHSSNTGRARIAMSVTTFEGIVENGQIRLPPDICLPEKAKVYVVIPNGDLPPPAFLASPRLAHPEEAIDFKKEVIQDPPNADV